MRIKNDFHINGFALCLAFKQRLGATRKWTILNCITQDFCTFLPLLYEMLQELKNICCTVPRYGFPVLSKNDFEYLSSFPTPKNDINLTRSSEINSCV